MTSTLDRSGFLDMGLAARAASLSPRWMLAQAGDRLTQMRAGGTPTHAKMFRIA